MDGGDGGAGAAEDQEGVGDAAGAAVGAATPAFHPLHEPCVPLGPARQRQGRRDARHLVVAIVPGIAKRTACGIRSVRRLKGGTGLYANLLGVFIGRMVVIDLPPRSV